LVDEKRSLGKLFESDKLVIVDFEKAFPNSSISFLDS
jgi:hypothetical protein